MTTPAMVAHLKNWKFQVAKPGKLLKKYPEIFDVTETHIQASPNFWKFPEPVKTSQENSVQDENNSNSVSLEETLRYSKFV